MKIANWWRITEIRIGIGIGIGVVHVICFLCKILRIDIGVGISSGIESEIQLTLLPQPLLSLAVLPILDEQCLVRFPQTHRARIWRVVGSEIRSHQQLGVGGGSYAHEEYINGYINGYINVEFGLQPERYCRSP